MKKIRYLLVMVLGIVMALAFAACGTNTPNDNSGNNSGDNSGGITIGGGGNETPSGDGDNMPDKDVTNILRVRA